MVQLSPTQVLRETADLLPYIEAMWETLRTNARHGHKDTFEVLYAEARNSRDGHLGDVDHDNPYILYLPFDFIRPGGRFTVQFYWDSYFILQSLLAHRRIDLAQGIVDNCLYLVSRYGLVIANRKRWAAGSQLPFLSSMVRDVYEVRNDKNWLAEAVPLVEREYFGYWLNGDHLTSLGLSRYHAPACYPAETIAAITIDNESTWDTSPRFDEDDILSLLPVDLNCNLYKYELDLAYFHDTLGNVDESAKWARRSVDRRGLINSLLYDEEDGLYYDRSYICNDHKRVKSLVTMFPLLWGIADEEQARRVVGNLALFEAEHGLTTCDHSYGYTDRQWNWPVGWAPLHWIAYQSLVRYGFIDDATRISVKWLQLNHAIWKSTGKLYEKYNVVTASHSVLDTRYTNQEGFGWTNAVFDVLHNALSSQA